MILGINKPTDLLKDACRSYIVLMNHPLPVVYSCNYCIISPIYLHVIYKGIIYCKRNQINTKNFIHIVLMAISFH